MLAIFCVAADREPYEGAERRMKISTYSTALEEIPTDDLLPLAQLQTQRPASRFVPTPYELKKLYHGAEASTDENGVVTFETRSHVAAYDSWDAQKARMKHEALPEVHTTHGHASADAFRSLGRCIVCNCTYPDGERVAAKNVWTAEKSTWVCAHGLCDFSLEQLTKEAAATNISEPKISVKASLALEPLHVKAPETAARLLCEKTYRVWKHLNDEQKQAMMDMAKWESETARNVCAENFDVMWDEFNREVYGIDVNAEVHDAANQ